MLKQLLKKQSLHDCAEDHRFEHSRNLSIVHFGVVWQCPDCRAFWYRQTVYVDGFTSILLRRETPDHLWRRLTKRQTFKLRWLVLRGLDQLEIAERMRFEPSGYDSLYPPSWLEDIEQRNQKPSSWVF